MKDIRVKNHTSISVSNSQSNKKEAFATNINCEYVLELICAHVAGELKYPNNNNVSSSKSISGVEFFTDSVTCFRDISDLSRNGMIAPYIPLTSPDYQGTTNYSRIILCSDIVVCLDSFYNQKQKCHESVFESENKCFPEVLKKVSSAQDAGFDPILLFSAAYILRSIQDRNCRVVGDIS